ncbi:hypothetical protein HJFPF1_09954 [Paramyrothecium foliicola]|nr:hypothetical protein HJFPF1_09954 [Paramyrothecium foliicola]
MAPQQYVSIATTLPSSSKTDNTFRSKRRFSLNISPAVKASNRVLGERSEKRGSVDSNISDHGSAVEAERQSLAPMQRWTTANRVG